MLQGRHHLKGGKMIKKIIKSMKLPAIIYFSTMIVGILLGLFVISPEIGEKVANLNAMKMENFIEISISNCTIILMIYLSVIFSKKYAYFVYGVNGIILGIFVSWILKSNINLLWLIIPHGIVEIPNMLATGYIVDKGEKFVRENFKTYIKIFIIHQLFTVFCAFIEAFITPYFQQFI